MESLRMSSAMFGRMFATGAYYICLQYASEIFPTSIRGSGLSACEIIGGIGLFMSPWIVYLVRIIYRWIELIVNYKKTIVLYLHVMKLIMVIFCRQNIKQNCLF